MANNFCAFILTYGRPEKVYTYHTLRNAGYTGDIYLICSDDDDTINQYREIYADSVIVFNKEEIAKTFDSFDNFEDRRAIVYARNYSFEAAKKLGYTYFIQLDDDYTEFRYTVNSRGEYLTKNQKIKTPKRLDNIFASILEFYKSIPAKSVCVSQGGDYIGGEGSSVYKKKLARKAMNSFFCSIERPFKFIGRINEDVNTYTSYQSKGNIFFTIHDIRLEQMQTQTNSGGMAELYLDSGTYIKSFYTIICSPSSVKIKMMGASSKRLHHQVNWKNAVPCIIRETYKK